MCILGSSQSTECFALHFSSGKGPLTACVLEPTNEKQLSLPINDGSIIMIRIHLSQKS